jgi:superfamily II DNA/RNA helicase
MKQPDERDVAARNSERDVSETGFAALGLDPRIASALAALGYEEPTPVQRAAIPPLLEGRDVLAQAATGTGKTAAFALPLLSRVNTNAKGAERTSALILVPTRELAMQVAEAVHRYGKPMGVSALAVYGGSSMEMQVRALKRGVDVVIATPWCSTKPTKCSTWASRKISRPFLRPRRSRARRRCFRPRSRRASPASRSVSCVIP